MDANKTKVISKILVKIIDLLSDKELILEIKKFRISKDIKFIKKAIERIKLIGSDTAFEVIKEISINFFEYLVELIMNKRVGNQCI